MDDATLSTRAFWAIFFDGPTGFNLGTPEDIGEGSAVTKVVRGGQPIGRRLRLVIFWFRIYAFGSRNNSWDNQ